MQAEHQSACSRTACAGVKPPCWTGSLPHVRARHEVRQLLDVVLHAREMDASGVAVADIMRYIVEACVDACPRSAVALRSLTPAVAASTHFHDYLRKSFAADVEQRWEEVQELLRWLMGVQESIDQALVAEAGMDEGGRDEGAEDASAGTGTAGAAAAAAAAVAADASASTAAGNSGSGRLALLLATASLTSDADLRKDNKVQLDAVTVCTIHSAKGLEWKVRAAQPGSACARL